MVDVCLETECSYLRDGYYKTLSTRWLSATRSKLGVLGHVKKESFV
jgi:hypothetical protein